MNNTIIMKILLCTTQISLHLGKKSETMILGNIFQGFSRFNICLLSSRVASSRSSRLPFVRMAHPFFVVLNPSKILTTRDIQQFILFSSWMIEFSCFLLFWGGIEPSPMILAPVDLNDELTTCVVVPLLSLLLGFHLHLRLCSGAPN